MKVAFQPQFAVIHGTVIGTKIAPILDPELKITVANDRCFFLEK
jgi:hypothetical protein